MGVPVQKKIAPLRRYECRNVLEMKAVAAEFEVQCHRPFSAVVAISAHHPHLCRHGFQYSQQRRLTDITEMPDFVSTGDSFADMIRQPIVRIRDDRDGFSIFDCLMLD
jgi:hypothetical protein